MQKVRKLLQFYNNLLTNDKYLDDSYVHDELIEGIKKVLKIALDGSGIPVDEDSTIEDYVNLIRKEQVEIFYVLPLHLCTDKSTNQELLLLLNVCMICLERFTLDDKKLITSKNGYDFFGNAHYILCTSDKFKGIKFICCMNVENFENEILTNVSAVCDLAKDSREEVTSILLNHVREGRSECREIHK